MWKRELNARIRGWLCKKGERKIKKTLCGATAASSKWISHASRQWLKNNMHSQWVCWISKAQERFLPFSITWNFPHLILSGNASFLTKTYDRWGFKTNQNLPVSYLKQVNLAWFVDLPSRPCAFWWKKQETLWGTKYRSVYVWEISVLFETVVVCVLITWAKQ